MKNNKKKTQNKEKMSQKEPFNLNKIDYKRLGFFNFKKLGRNYLLTNDTGRFVILKPEDFKNFVEGSLEKDKEPYLTLKKENFLKQELEIDKEVNKFVSKNHFLFKSPDLHIIVLTLRCNHRCVYCHASAQDMSQKDVDMDKETADKVLENIFSTPGPTITIEFQGGEPLANWPILKYIVEEAYKKNKKIGKNLEIKLVTNLDLMTEERYDFLINNDVAICTSIDGPRKLHNKNRPLIGGGDDYKKITKWIKRFNKDYSSLIKKGYIWKISALTTISRDSLKMHKEIIDEYLRLGFRDIFLRPLDPFGFSNQSWRKIGYSEKEFISFYKKSLDYIIQKNLKGNEFIERGALFFLKKILTDNDPNMMEMRSPCGGGIGQIAYDFDGSVYTCDEGRMLGMMGDDSFKIGDVKENSYEEIVTHPVVRTVCSTSCLQGLAGCSDCVYRPYCATCPIYNYFKQGTIFGQMPTNEKCKINSAILDYLFKKIQKKESKEVFNNWLKN